MAASSSNRSKLTYPHPWKLRFASIALIFKWLAGMAVIVGLSLGLGLGERTWLLVSIGGVAAFVVLAIISLVLGSELPCNVCRHPLLIAKDCRKHVKARRFLGVSHRLGVAVPAVFTNRIHCMYCGEKIPLGARRGASPEPPALEAEAAPEDGLLSESREDPSLPAPR